MSKPVTYASFVAVATLLLGGCAVPSLGIRLGTIPAASGKVEVVDLRPERRKHIWRDPKFGRMAKFVQRFARVGTSRARVDWTSERCSRSLRVVASTSSR